MLDSIGSIFDKNFIVGHVLPTTIFFSLVCGAFPEVLITNLLVFDQGQEGEPSVVASLLFLLVSSLLISIGNTRIYRLFEGYYWPISNSEKALEIERSRFQKMSREYKCLKEMVSHFQGGKPSGDEQLKKYREAQKLLKRLRTSFPKELTDILPTQLGNAIRSFERYPNSIHGADGIAVWTRVYSIAPDRSVELVRNAKANCDFFVNITFYALLMAAVCIGMIIFHLIAAFSSSCVDERCIETAVNGGLMATLIFFLSLITAKASYSESVSMAKVWGETVRTLYDVAIPKLLEVFGCDDSANDRDKRLFLEKLSMRAVYLEPQDLNGRKTPSETGSSD